MIGIEIRVDTTTKNALLRRLNPKKVGDVSREAMSRSVRVARDFVVAGMPKLTRQLVDSVYTNITLSMGVAVGEVGTEIEYGEVIEYGRTPGRFPPKSAIVRWLSLKGINTRYWFVVARAIASRRSPLSHPFGYRMFENAAEKLRQVVPGIWQRIIERRMFR